MRIITGTAKGCRLKAPKGMLTRPTADRVKESLFNILGADIIGTKVLDLFAGTGNLGLEALSRGAELAVFVDQNANSIGVIKENAAHTKLIAKAEIFKGDVLQVLRRLCLSARKFDVVFCDPPYAQGLAKSVLTALDDMEILVPGAIIMIEHARKDDLASAGKHFTLKRTQIYGSTAVSFFIWNDKNKKEDTAEGAAK